MNCYVQRSDRSWHLSGMWAEPDQIVYSLAHSLYSVIGSGDLRQAVILPPGEDANEWIAVNTVDFFEQVRRAKNNIIVMNMLKWLHLCQSHLHTFNILDQHAVRDNHRVLHGEDLSRDERRIEIRIFVGGH